MQVPEPAEVQVPGLEQVLAVRADGHWDGHWDGRWDAAYAGKDFAVAQGFLAALAAASEAARVQFAGLNRKSLSAHYCRLTTARRAKHAAEFVAMLEHGALLY